MLNKTQFLLTQKEEIEEEIEKKDRLIKELKGQIEGMQKENAEYIQSAEKSEKGNHSISKQYLENKRIVIA